MSWIKQRSCKESLAIITDISQLCSNLGGPTTKLLQYFVVTGDYRRVIDFKIDYNSIDLVDAIYSRQIIALFSKLDFLDLGIDREQVAFDKFLHCEETCRETNKRFRFGVTDLKRSATVESVLFHAQRKISNIVNPLPSLDSLDFAFGPGANTNVLSSRACPRAKLSASVTCSANLTPFVDEFLNEIPHWTELHLKTGWYSKLDDLSGDEYALIDVAVSNGKLKFVPKSSLTDRPIVVEPLLNSFFQKGFGKFLRSRLLREGVDLTDQGRNQSLALKGSVDGSLASIDISSASDCMSKNLIYDLFPVDFWSYLDALRTPSVDYRDTTIRLEKFSSMGNGFTFELESLIFYAILHSCCVVTGESTKDISVYGDDLIVPVSVMPLITEVLTYIGFSVNLDKSYWSGPFRESCGADFLSGFDIRPFYLKTRLSDRNLYTMHNWFLKHGEFKLAELVKSFTHPHERLFGPNGYGDGHLIGSYNIRLNRDKRKRGWCGGFFDTYTLSPCFFKKPMKGDYVLPLYSVYTRSGERDPTDPNVVRGSRGYAKISIYTLSTSVFR